MEEKVDPEATPGEVLSQSPAAGEEAEKDSEVTIEVAVGDGKVEVPDLTGKTAVETDKILRDAELTRGQVNPQPADPEGKVDSQIPAAGEIVAAGTPVDVFLVEAAADEGGGGGGGGGGGAEAEAAAAAAAVAAAPPRR